MLSYQQWALISRNIAGTISEEAVKEYSWVKSQSIFMSREETKSLQGSLEDAVELTLNSEIVLGNKLSVFDMSCDVNSSELISHPLTLRGVCMVHPKNADHGYDTSTTLVSFYYPLGYDTKPNDVYMRSLEKFANLHHPIVFFGNKDVCKFFESKSNKVMVKAIVKPIEEWELVKENKEEFKVELQKKFYF